MSARATAIAVTVADVVWRGGRATLALTLQPAEEEYVVLPPSPFSEGDLLIFGGFVVIVAIVLGFDTLKIWWTANRWKRDERRRRRMMR